MYLHQKISECTYCVCIVFQNTSAAIEGGGGGGKGVRDDGSIV